MRKLQVVYITPGQFSIPFASHSSVEHTVMETAAMLTNSANVIIISKKRSKDPKQFVWNGIQFIYVERPTAKKYVKGICSRLALPQQTIIQVENRPRYISEFKRAFPHCSIWLSLHSLTYLRKPYISLRALQKNIQLADQIIVNSQFMRNRLLDLAPLSAEKTRVNHLGVNVSMFPSRWDSQNHENERKLWREQQGYFHHKLILFAGRLLPIKGVHHLLEILPDLVEKEPHIQLIIAGSSHIGSTNVTPYVNRIHQMGSRFPNNVKFLPFLSHYELSKWFRMADIAVVPSFAEEAFGLINVEAMSAGLPVVATRAGGIPEIVIHGKHGLLADPNDIQRDLLHHLLYLAANDTIREQMGREAAEHVRNYFTWQQSASRLLDLYLLSFKINRRKK